MRDFIFARTRWDYGPYWDFWRLVELSGFKWTWIDTADWQNPDLTVIASPWNGEWFPHLDNRKARLIHWNLERPSGSEQYNTANTDQHGIDETWVSDKALAERTGAKFVFLGGHRAFAEVATRHKDYDYLTLSANFGRRTWPFARLAELYSCADIEGGTWGDERADRMQRAKLLVNIHQDEHPWHEPLRFMLAASYAIPVLSETCEKAGLLEPGKHYIEASLQDIPATIKWLLENEIVRLRLAANLWRLCCVEHTFKDSVMEAV